MRYQILEGCFSAATDGTADFVEQRRRMGNGRVSEGPLVEMLEKMPLRSACLSEYASTS